MLRNLLTYFSKNIDPLVEAEARNKIKLAFTVEEKMLSTKLSKKSKEQAEELIIYLLNDAFTEIIPNKEEIELFDKYSDLTFEEEKEGDIINMKTEMEFMFAMQGIDIDLTDVDIENEEEMAKLMRELQDKIQNKKLDDQQQEFEIPKQKAKKKTQKEIEREALEKAKIEAQTKSLKRIYISLSKALHPDTETDPLEKAKKEELMKKVTAAYQEKNFPLLLRLELEWIHQTTEHLNDLNEDKLKVYIEILLDRERELLAEKFRLVRDPRFEKISSYAHMIEKSAIKAIDNHKNGLKSNEKLYATIEKIFKLSQTKNDITAMIEDLCFKFIGIAEEEDFYNSNELFLKLSFCS
ncbi:MAG: hypothetical protein HYR91_06775 [Flavobacteriia bacterium]|nr:hypothetical protein [Flavobacteriia bacterium]